VPLLDPLPLEPLELVELLPVPLPPLLVPGVVA
jgi:hypothetical protein